jgi:hypothetical protein
LKEAEHITGHIGAILSASSSCFSIIFSTGKSDKGLLFPIKKQEEKTVFSIF